MKKIIWIIALLSSNAHAILESRLGGLAYFDTNLGITWAANPTLTGLGSWNDQQTAITNLDIGGVTGWRMASGGQFGVDEYLSLYLNDGINSATPGVFGSIPDFDFFWTGQEFSTVFVPDGAIAFLFGNQIDFDVWNKGTRFFAWAVHDGDVATIPEPSVLALIGLGLVGFARLKHGSMNNPTC